jgi:hypothetical protein
MVEPRRLASEDLRLTAPEPPTIRSPEVTVNFNADRLVAGGMRSISITHATIKQPIRLTSCSVD